MQSEPIFTAWAEHYPALWSNQPMRLEHRLDRSPLFSREALARLIDAYPREHYSLVQVGAPGKRRLWREGEIGQIGGAEVIEAIATGRLWLNLRKVPEVDPRYGDLVAEIFAELGGRIPGFETFDRTIGILISSPGAQVYYHADLPGQSLWQIEGRKKVYVYPPVRPFLAPQHLEDIALFGVEVNMPYDPWYDEHAVTFELAPGQMLHWPLNAPHRIENLDCLNISMTMEYWTPDIRRAHMVNLANGILRHRFGFDPKSRSTQGLQFWGKAVTQKLMRNSPKLKRERQARRPIDFRLDPGRIGHIIDTAAAAE